VLTELFALGVTADVLLERIRGIA